MTEPAAVSTERRRVRAAVDVKARVVVVVASASGGDLVTRMRRQSYDVMSVEIAPSLVNDVASADADVVLIAYERDAFDLVRLCRVLRESIESRIIVVDAHTGEGNRTSTHTDDAFVADVLDAGADDFASATITDAVLAARLRVAIRARPPRVPGSQRHCVGDLVLDAEAHIVTIADEVVKVPPLQFHLLLILIRQPGVMVHRDRIVTELWGAQAGSFNPRRLRVAVSVLRGIIGHGPVRPRVETVAHLGYRLAGVRA